MEETAELYAYEPYDGPLLESVDLYKAKSGEELINEQIYSFEDRGERFVAIRPEMTPTLARMVPARLGSSRHRTQATTSGLARFSILHQLRVFGWIRGSQH